MDRTPLVIVAGATACGKSQLALRLAQAVDAEIVSLDSVQCFREFTIGSAKPSDADQAAVAHHLIDQFDPDDQVDARVFVNRMEQAIQDIVTRGRKVMVVGGTTMYLTALLHGLVESPEVPEALRQELRRLSLEDLRAKLLECDPAIAEKLSAQDRPRMERAIAVSTLAGRPFSEIQREHAFRDCRHTALIIVPMWSRDTLYDRINQRVDEMVRIGLLDEARRIVARYGPDVHALRSLGYAQCLSVIRGELAEEELATEIAQATRHFAKRQLTYLRNEPKKRGWNVRPDQNLGSTALTHTSSPEASARRTGKMRLEMRSERVGLEQLMERVRRTYAEGLQTTEVWFVEALGLGIDAQRKPR